MPTIKSFLENCYPNLPLILISHSAGGQQSGQIIFGCETIAEGIIIGTNTFAELLETSVACLSEILSESGSNFSTHKPHTWPTSGPPLPPKVSGTN